jgi:hypothetical protein
MILYYAKLDNLDYFIAKLDSLAYFIDKLDSLDYFIAKWDILVDNIHKLYLPLTNINSVSPACEYLVEQHYGGKDLFLAHPYRYDITIGVLVKLLLIELCD